MKINFKKTFIWTVVIFILMGLIIPGIDSLYFSEGRAFKRGEIDAVNDVSLEIIKYKFNGIPNEIGQKFINELRALGIEVSVMDAGERDEFSYRNGYNSIIDKYIYEHYKIHAKK